LGYAASPDALKAAGRSGEFEDEGTQKEKCLISAQLSSATQQIQQKQRKAKPGLCR